MMGLSKNSNRLSGVELVKIIGIFLIVISHVTQTLGKSNLSINYQDYVILLGNASRDVQVVILSILRQTGALGNNIFFICSAWFLVGKEKTSRKKAFNLLCTVWTVSVLILAIYLIFNPSCLTFKDIIKQLLPTCFANNWYLTAYIIFLFIYPWLNKFISIISQKQLLRIVLFSSLLWIVIDYLKGDWFFPSSILLWIVVYFLIAYLKIYCKNLMINKKIGMLLLFIGLVGSIAQVVVTNYVGIYLLHVFADKVLRWNTNCCPFYILIALGSLIIGLNSKFKSRFINYVSSLTLFIYLIHENYLFRTYTRPYIWHLLYTNVGYKYVVLLDLGYSVILFILAVLVSCLYCESIQKLVNIIANKLYALLSKLYQKIESFFLKLN